MGLVKLRSGEILLDEVNLSALPGHARAAHQIGYSPEDRVIFPTMSVEENLRLPCATLKQSKQAIEQRLEVVTEAVPDLKPRMPPHLLRMAPPRLKRRRSEEHTSELQSLMRISYAVFCLKKK